MTCKAGDDLIAAKSSCRVGASELHVQLNFAADPAVCCVPTQVITYVRQHVYGTKQGKILGQCLPVHLMLLKIVLKIRLQLCFYVLSRDVSWRLTYHVVFLQLSDPFLQLDAPVSC